MVLDIAFKDMHNRLHHVLYISHVRISLLWEERRIDTHDGAIIWPAIREGRH